MPRITITITEEFKKRLDEYRSNNNLSSLSEAIVSLAANQLNYAAPAKSKWGGNRMPKGDNNEE